MAQIGKRKDLEQIRAIACISVVILHTFRTFINQKMMTHTGYITASVIRDLMNYAVPCFLMVTGALLLDETRDVSIKKIWKKYIPSVGIPLIICTIIFCITDAVFDGTVSSYIIKDVLIDIWTDSSWKHLWYVYMLIGIYVLLPFYRKIAEHSSNKELMYLTCMWLIFIVVIPQIGIITGTKSGFYVCTYTVYPLLLFIGYMSDKRKLLWKHPEIVFLVSAVLMGLFSYLAYGAEIKTALKMIGTYAFLPVIFMATGLFQWRIRSSKAMPAALEKMFSRIDECGFGIYIYHVLFIRIVKTFYHPSTISLPVIFGISIIILFITWGFVFCIRKLPVINHIC